MISIHALRKESDMAWLRLEEEMHISIHALRKESDQQDLRLQIRRPISIHALRKESDIGYLNIPMSFKNFNPRSP